jgi:porin
MEPSERSLSWERISRRRSIQWPPPAIRIFVQPVSKFYALVGAYYGNTGAQDKNTTGFNFDFDADNGALVFSEMGFPLNQSPNDRGLGGTYKIGSFVHIGQFSTWNSQAEDALGTGGLNDIGANYGFYGVIDQEIYKAGGRTIGLFVRGGFAPGNINFVNGYIDCGFNFIGFIPGRFRDVAGIAFAHSFVRKDFSDADQFQGNPAS